MLDEILKLYLSEFNDVDKPLNKNDLIESLMTIFTYNIHGTYYMSDIQKSTFKEIDTWIHSNPYSTPKKICIFINELIHKSISMMLSANKNLLNRLATEFEEVSEDIEQILSESDVSDDRIQLVKDIKSLYKVFIEKIYNYQTKLILRLVKFYKDAKILIDNISTNLSTNDWDHRKNIVLFNNINAIFTKYFEINDVIYEIADCFFTEEEEDCYIATRYLKNVVVRVNNKLKSFSLLDNYLDFIEEINN